MAKRDSGLIDAGWLPFDLLGNPVPANKGCKGRPQHRATPENLEKIILLYAQGRSDVEVAAALGVTVPTLRRHYFSHPELQKARRNARLVVEAELLARLNAQSKEGNTAATDKLMRRLDLIAADKSVADRRVKPSEEKPKSERVGKKEERLRAAQALKGQFEPLPAPPGTLN